MKQVTALVITLFATQTLRAETLALAGDSTVATYSSGEKQGWGYSFSKYVISKLRVANHAAGGRTTKTFRDEGRWKKLLGTKPHFIFVQFGHNDSRSENNVSVKSYRANLERFILEAEKQNALIYMVTPPHRCKFKNGKVTDEMRAYVDAMKSVAKQYEVPILDLYKRNGDLLNKMGTKACKEYYLSSSDTTHFNKKGSSMMASLVAEEAKKDADLAPFLK